MKKLILLLFIVIATVNITGCKKDDGCEKIKRKEAKIVRDGYQFTGEYYFDLETKYIKVSTSVFNSYNTGDLYCE